MTSIRHTYPLSTKAGFVEITVTDSGAGRPFLLLHGGGGPQTVAGFADLLASTRDARVIIPVHPGFDGTVRPDALASIGELAAVYVALLDEMGLTDVTVVGNSMGGWIAAEMVLLHSASISSVIIVDGAGIEVPGHPVADLFSLTMDQVAKLSYHDPEKFGIDVSKLPPAALAAMAGNRASLAAYAGTTMADPSLAGAWPASRSRPWCCGARPTGSATRLRPRFRRRHPRSSVPAAHRDRPSPADRNSRAAARSGLGLRRR